MHDLDLLSEKSGESINSFLYDGHLLLINCINTPEIIQEFTYGMFCRHMDVLYIVAASTNTPGE